MTDEQKALMYYMSDLSEENYCAGWLIGLEFSLWEVLQGDRKAFAGGHLRDDEVEKLKSLSEKCGGWIYWDDRPWDEPHRTGPVGKTFITLEDWKAMFQKHNEP